MNFLSRYWISIVTKHAREFHKNMFVRIYTENLSDKFFFAVRFFSMILFWQFLSHFLIFLEARKKFTRLYTKAWINVAKFWRLKVLV